MLYVHGALHFSSSSAEVLTSSQPSSIPSGLTISRGDGSSYIAAGSRMRLSLSGSCFQKLSVEHWRNWPSVSYTPLNLVERSADHVAVFEDKDMTDRAVIAVEKAMLPDDMSVTSPESKTGNQAQVESIEATTKDATTKV
jgi:hypothetical protein